MASNITRRSLLQLSSALAGTTLLPSSPAVARAQKGRKTVLVLGAGMSGLTAALALLRRGHDVKVIEYQNRVGGRLLSLPLKGGAGDRGRRRSFSFKYALYAFLHSLF